MVGVKETGWGRVMIGVAVKYLCLQSIDDDGNPVGIRVAEMIGGEKGMPLSNDIVCHFPDMAKG